MNRQTLRGRCICSVGKDISVGFSAALLDFKKVFVNPNVHL